MAIDTNVEAKRLYDINRAAGFPENSDLVPTVAQWKALLEVKKCRELLNAE